MAGVHRTEWEEWQTFVLSVSIPGASQSHTGVGKSNQATGILVLLLPLPSSVILGEFTLGASVSPTVKYKSRARGFDVQSLPP